MSAKSIKGLSTAEIKEALKKRIEDGFKLTLLIVFFSNPELVMQLTVIWKCIISPLVAWH